MVETRQKGSYENGARFERISALHLNEDMVGHFGSSDFRTWRCMQMESEHIERMKHIIRACSKKYADWGFKDPRTSLTYPYWAKMLPSHKLIAVYRHYTAVWHRYKWVNPVKNVYRAFFFMVTWCTYNQRILKHMRQKDRQSIPIRYHSLMTTQEELQRLEEFIGRPLPDVRDADLYHSQPGFSPLVLMAKYFVHALTGMNADEIWAALEQLRTTERDR